MFSVCDDQESGGGARARLPVWGLCGAGEEESAAWKRLSSSCRCCVRGDETGVGADAEVAERGEDESRDLQGDTVRVPCSNGAPAAAPAAAAAVVASRRVRSSSAWRIRATSSPLARSGDVRTLYSCPQTSPISSGCGAMRPRGETSGSAPPPDESSCFGDAVDRRAREGGRRMAKGAGGSGMASRTAFALVRPDGLRSRRRRGMITLVESSGDDGDGAEGAVAVDRGTPRMESSAGGRGALTRRSALLSPLPRKCGRPARTTASAEAAPTSSKAAAVSASMQHRVGLRQQA